MGPRQLFNGRRFNFLAAARGLIFLGEHADEVVARVQQRSEGWHGELRRAHEDEACHVGLLRICVRDISIGGHSNGWKRLNG